MPKPKKIAVVIGVNKTGGLPLLDAATKGAKKFGEWAIQQDYELKLLIDESKPITLRDIKEAITDCVSSRTYDQLIIYFAGHGILKGPNDEYWLLSNSPDDTNEAVNVLASKYLAYESGIPHITFISDACRSVPSDLRITQVTGGTIFPNLGPASIQPDIDVFYATRPGDAAYEVRDELLTTKGYKGVFTSCMLEGLNGKVNEIMKEFPDGNPDSVVVYPYELKQYLHRRVPIATSDVKIDLVQQPRIEITSRPPKFLSRFKGSGFLGNEEAKRRFGSLSDDFAATQMDISAPLFDIRKVLNPYDDPKKDILLNYQLKDLKSASQIDTPPFNTGFIVTGKGEFEVDILPEDIPFDLYEKNYLLPRHHEIEYFPVPQELKFVILKINDLQGNERFTPLAVLADFVGTILVENGLVVSINYVPSKNSYRYQQYLMRKEEVEARRSAVTLASRHGEFIIGNNPYGLNNLAGYLRSEKALDPTLGLFAAYSYLQKGRHSDIMSVFEYMYQEQNNLLYDVKLLAALGNREVVNWPKNISPFCPVLTQGWSYLSLIPYFDNEKIKALSAHLVPGLWTTFTNKALPILRNYFNY